MKHGRGAHSAISSCESTGRSAAVFDGSDGAVLDEVARHPVVLAAGEVLDRLAEDVPMQLHAAFAG